MATAKGKPREKPAAPRPPRKPRQKQPYLPGAEDLNNRKQNLRITDAFVNQQNRAGPNKNSTTGCRGVYRCKQTGRWAVRYNAFGKLVWVGRFDTYEQAVAALPSHLSQE